MIREHQDKSAIEGLILSSKIKGIGFREIAKEISLKYGIKISHTSISNYYKRELNGELISKSIEEMRKSLLVGVGSDESIVKPSLDLEVYNTMLESTNKYISDSFNGTNGKEEMRGELSVLLASIVGLIRGNMRAHIEGREPLKSDYLRYYKELRQVIQSPMYSK